MSEIPYSGFEAAAELQPHIFGPVSHLFSQAALPEVVLKVGAKGHFLDITSNLGLSHSPFLISSCPNSPQF